MKKRTLAILMILVLATSGLFAVTVPGTVSAFLKANIGEYFTHGFNNGTTLYNSSIEVQDAFSVNAPSFRYGYKTNATSGNYSFKMTVGDFVNQNTAGSVKIRMVNSSKTITQQGTTNEFEIFAITGSSADLADEALITIRPFLSFTPGDVDITGATITAANTVNGDATNSGAPAGEYIATVSFSITAS